MSSPLTREDVAKVAALARLTLTEAELELFTEQLGKVLPVSYTHLRAHET